MSIRRRLTIMLLVGQLPLTCAIGVALFVFVRASLLSRFDGSLRARADVLMAATTWEDAIIDFDFDDVAMAQYARDVDPEYFELCALDERSGTTTLVHAAPALKQKRIDERAVFSTTIAVWDLSLPDGRWGRALVRRFRPRFDAADVTDATSEQIAAANAAPGPLLGLIVARSRSDVDVLLSDLTLGLIGSALLLTSAGVFVVRLSLASALQPVESLAAAVQAVDLEHLDRRVDVGSMPPEIEQIQDCLNTLLHRMRASLERERRFTNAAAHELRTPIAELRMMLEVNRSRRRSFDELDSTMAAALASATNLDRLVDALTRLTRLHSGREHLVLVPTDMHALVNRLISGQNSSASCIRILATGALTALVDERMAEIALDNLIRNSIEYRDPGSPIDIAIDQVSGYITLHIHNQAQHLSQDDVTRFGEPFWRSDESRSDERHMGLGVHLSRTMIDAMLGELAFEQPQPGTVRARIRLRAPGDNAPHPIVE